MLFVADAPVLCLTPDLCDPQESLWVATTESSISKWVRFYSCQPTMRQRQSKKVNYIYTQGNSFSKEKRRAALVWFESMTHTYCTYSPLLLLCISAALVAQWAEVDKIALYVGIDRGAKQTYRIACFVCDWHCTYLTCF